SCVVATMTAILLVALAARDEKGVMISSWSRTAGSTSLAQHRRLLALDQRKIDRRAEARAGGRVHQAACVDSDVLLEPVLLRAVGQQHLEEFAVLDRHDHVQVGEIVERIAAV